MVCVCVCVCVRACVRACVSINKKVTSFVPRKQTKEQKKRRRRHRRPERWNLTVLWLCSFWSKSFKKRERERERERERCGLIFWFFHFFAKRAGRRKKRSCSTFPSHKKKRATMADVQHERGYQKQVGVNVG